MINQYNSPKSNPSAIFFINRIYCSTIECSFVARINCYIKQIGQPTQFNNYQERIIFLLLVFLENVLSKFHIINQVYCSDLHAQSDIEGYKCIVMLQDIACQLGWDRVMVFNATFNDFSAISWRAVLLVEETGVP